MRRATGGGVGQSALARGRAQNTGVLLARTLPQGRVAVGFVAQNDAVGLLNEQVLGQRLAVDAVMAAETALGFVPRDVGKDKRGYDVESTIPGSGVLRFIEVKGRTAGAETVTVTVTR